MPLRGPRTPDSVVSEEPEKVFSELALDRQSRSVPAALGGRDLRGAETWGRQREDDWSVPGWRLNLGQSQGRKLLGLCIFSSLLEVIEVMLHCSLSTSPKRLDSGHWKQYWMRVGWLVVICTVTVLSFWSYRELGITVSSHPFAGFFLQ